MNPHCTTTQDTPLKRCTRCGKSKPLDSFYRNKKYKSGRESRCKSCSNDDRKKYPPVRDAYTPEQRRAWFNRWAGKPEALRRKREYRKSVAHTEAYRVSKQQRRQRYEASAKGKITKLRKYMKRRDAGGNVTVDHAHWDMLLNLFGNRCAYCRTDTTMTIDHFVPLARGGRTEPGNIVPCCLSCNSSKQDAMPEQWLTKTVYFIVKTVLDR